MRQSILALALGSVVAAGPINRKGARRLMSAMIVAGLVFLSGGTRASMIESGIFYNPSEPGRGYSIEQQGGQLTLIFYAYQSSGAPVWYYASAPYFLNSSGYPTMTTTIGLYTGGQCLGCSFRSPTRTGAGTVTIQFSSAQLATITLGSSSGAFGSGGGSSIDVERFDFSDVTNPLLGQWAFTFSIGSPTYANTYGGFVRFTTVGPPANAGSTGLVTGSPGGYAGECFSGGSLSGSCLISFGSDSFIEYYVIPWPLNEWRGYYSISGGSGSRYRVHGIRVAAAGEATLFGLGTGAAVAVAAGEGDLGAIVAAKRAADMSGRLDRSAAAADAFDIAALAAAQIAAARAVATESKAGLTR